MHIKKWLERNGDSGDYALITGTTSGIGEVYAHQLAKIGVNLICISNEREKLEAQKVTLTQKYKIDVKILDVDLSSPESTLQIAEKCRQLSISILINNAGFGLKGTFESNEISKYVDIINVNTVAPVVFLHAILPQMQEKNRGLVINIASINALVPIPNNQVYTATKAFLLSFALAVSRENKDREILFQLVLPGTTKTPFHDKQQASPTTMVMTPEAVVGKSLENVKRYICIPNQMDWCMSFLVPLLPFKLAMDIASYLLKKRLGV